MTDDMLHHFAGKKLYGDDFSIDQIEERFRAE